MSLQTQSREASYAAPAFASVPEDDTPLGSQAIWKQEAPDLINTFGAHVPRTLGPSSQTLYNDFPG